MTYSTSVAVVGAGHAGIEAALASARLGVDTVLFTTSFEAIGNLPCNPSIGGTAKGHLVYEVDALGGAMSKIADKVTLQSRTLNTGKGAAVQSKRIQADRAIYHIEMKHLLEKTPHLRLIQAEIIEIITEKVGDNQKIVGVKTKLGDVWQCQCAVMATGTYLSSAIFVGDCTYEAGPDGFLPAKGLSESLSEHGIEMRRFKTGTPARVKKETIDFSQLEVQPGETEIALYSWSTDAKIFENFVDYPCHIVYTNAETHKVIRENIKRSALYSGNIKGTGPRYCPSIEDKLVRFADKERHQLFVEPLGKDTEEMYMQGFSTSLPTDVQEAMLHTLKGFENAQMMRYAYAIEYDCANPLQMFSSLEFKNCEGLYGAGQFNGTSGYEEAAAQGLVAGCNAGRKVLGKEPMILPRHSSYTGTLIDDLVTKGTNEPYRMMTSRSEYRLLLRQDTSDMRLTPIGYEMGLVSEEQYSAFLQRKKMVEAEIERLTVTHLSPEDVNEFLENLGETPVKSGISLADLLRRPGITLSQLRTLDKKAPALPRSVLTTVENNIKYEGYEKREMAQVERTLKLEEKRLPPDLDYSQIKGLRLEAIQKLNKIKPLTVGQASRISGVNPADISVLFIYLGIK